MTDRMELNDEEMKKVVGGAFNFYTSKSGAPKCFIDGAGSYFCSDAAFAWTVNRTAGSSDPSSVVLAEGVAAGYFWQ